MLNCPKGIFSFSSFPHYDKPENCANTQLISSIKFISCCYCKTNQETKQNKKTQARMWIPNCCQNRSLSFSHIKQHTASPASTAAAGSCWLSWEMGTLQMSPWTTERHSTASHGHTVFFFFSVFQWLRKRGRSNRFIDIAVKIATNP